MPADAFSPFIGMVLPAFNNNNAWGTLLNESALQILKRAIAGNVTNAVTGGTLDLSGLLLPLLKRSRWICFRYFPAP